MLPDLFHMPHMPLRHKSADSSLCDIPSTRKIKDAAHFCRFEATAHLHHTKTGIPAFHISGRNIDIRLSPYDI
jgi:hypothetical protein